jgi:predicted nucleic acid-binding protein
MLDTDIAVSFLRGSERAKQRVRTAIPDGIGFSFVSLAELYDGIHQSTDPASGERDSTISWKGSSWSGSTGRRLQSSGEREPG